MKRLKAKFYEVSVRSIKMVNAVANIFLVWRKKNTKERQLIDWLKIFFNFTNYGSVFTIFDCRINVPQRKKWRGPKIYIIFEIQYLFRRSDMLIGFDGGFCIEIW